MKTPVLPIPPEVMIRLTAEGMLRNHGVVVAEDADRMADGYAGKEAEGQALWKAVAEKIRNIRHGSRTI